MKSYRYMVWGYGLGSSGSNEPPASIRKEISWQDEQILATWRPFSYTSKTDVSNVTRKQEETVMGYQQKYEWYII